ncbi:adenylate cyclase [Vigna unguiculata]|uniref:Adenylate cyclase n=1 Tax=Vigna unguiculata TaxID=3917 RepID=A0A4D6NMK4_VIGUN|nr:adenylate cyclase [Vigna unguiculata]
MAEAVVEFVLGKLSSLVGKALALFLGLHDDLERLASLLTTIKATLEDAEHKQFLDRAIRIWLQDLKDAALALDDIMDECGYEVLGMEFQRLRIVSNKGIKTGECGKVKSFKIHDLAQFVATDVCCVSKHNHVTTLSERIHHLSIYGNDSIQLHQVNSLRTYIRHPCYIGQYCEDVLKCDCLSVHQDQLWESLPSSIGHLKHLRYLNLSGGTFKTLPKSVCKLWNLQILKLDYCKHLLKLPDNLVRLKGLQQISLKGCRFLRSLPPHVGNLTSLRILSMYIVGKKRGSLLAELGPLKLKGDLEIKYMGKVKSVRDAEEANMSSKQLNTLRLSWHRLSWDWFSQDRLSSHTTKTWKYKKMLRRFLKCFNLIPNNSRV